MIVGWPLRLTFHFVNCWHLLEWSIHRKYDCDQDVAFCWRFAAFGEKEKILKVELKQKPFPKREKCKCTCTFLPSWQKVTRTFIIILSWIFCTLVWTTQIETGQVGHQAYLHGWRLGKKINMDPCFVPFLGPRRWQLVIPWWKASQDLWGSLKILKDLLKILKDEDLSKIFEGSLKWYFDQKRPKK